MAETEHLAGLGQTATPLLDFSPLEMFCVYGWRTIFIQVLLWEIPPSCSSNLRPLLLSAEFFYPIFLYLLHVTLFLGAGGHAQVWEQPFFLPLPKGACPFLLPPLLLHLQLVYNDITLCLFQINQRRITIHQIHW